MAEQEEWISVVALVKTKSAEASQLIADGFSEEGTFVYESLIDALLQQIQMAYQSTDNDSEESKEEDDGSLSSADSCESDNQLKSRKATETKDQFTCDFPIPNAVRDDDGSPGASFAESNYNDQKPAPVLHDALILKDKKLVLAIDSCIQPKRELKWTDVVVSDKVKTVFEEAVVWPLQVPWYFNEHRPICRGILMYGVPGTGKTRLVQTVGSISQAVVFEIRGSDVKSKWLGSSDKFVKALFARARQCKQAIIFIDEVDGLLASKFDENNSSVSGIVNEFLIEMNTVNAKSEGSVVVIAATNYPDKLEGAFLRRFDYKIRIPMPCEEDRKMILRNLMEHFPNSLQDKDYNLLSKKSNGLTGSDIAAAVQHAAKEPLRRAKKLNVAVEKCLLEEHVQLDDLLTALKRKPTVNQAMLDALSKFDGDLNDIGVQCTTDSRVSRLKKFMNAVLRNS